MGLAQKDAKESNNIWRNRYEPKYKQNNKCPFEVPFPISFTLFPIFFCCITVRAIKEVVPKFLFHA